MIRRAFLASAALLPSIARAQSQPPLIGVIRVGGFRDDQFTPVFRRDLARLGLEENRHFRLKVVQAENDTSRLAPLADALTKEGAAMLVAFGNAGVAAAQSVTKNVPIVAMANDLVGGGLVGSMARPGGNTTGVSIMAHELEEKRVEVLHELVPAATRIGVLEDPGTTAPAAIDNLRASAAKLGLTIATAAVAKPAELSAAFETLAAAKVEAVSVFASPFLNALRARQIEEMNRRRWPAIYEWPETVEEGGLASYAPRISLVYRHVAIIAAKVLRGAKPADLPIEQPTIFTLALNTGAAKKIGLLIPEAMLLRADVVVD